MITPGSPQGGRARSASLPLPPPSPACPDPIRPTSLPVHERPDPKTFPGATPEAQAEAKCREMLALSRAHQPAPLKSYPLATIPPFPVTEIPRTGPGSSAPFDVGIPAHRLALMADRARLQGIAPGPTSFRPATASEERFTCQAHQAIRADLAAHPGRQLRGEYAFLGDAQGNLLPFRNPDGAPTGEMIRYFPGTEVSFQPHELAGASVVGHSHPPGREPLTSTASDKDHIFAAGFFRVFGGSAYMTDGQRMNLINPTDTGLVALTPRDAGNPPPSAYPAVPARRRADSLPA